MSVCRITYRTNLHQCPVCPDMDRSCQESGPSQPEPGDPARVPDSCRVNYWVIWSIVRQDRTRTDSEKETATGLPTPKVFISEDTSLIRKDGTASPKVGLRG